MIPFILTSNSVTVVVKGKPYTVTAGTPQFAEITNRIKAKDYAGIEALFDMGTALKEYVRGKIAINGDTVSYNGRVLGNPVVNRIKEFMRQGLDYRPLVAFLENLMQNPSKTAVDELYLFLESGQMPLTEDGCFLAFRKVRDDYKDFYTGTFDNSVGKTLEMPRNEVNEDRHTTCSYGFHFCSQAYLPRYHGGEGRSVIVKINPADVVTIPSDYGNSKGRCFRYTVWADCPENEKPADMGVFVQTAPVAAAAPVAETYDSEGLNSFNLGVEDGKEDALDGDERDADEALQSRQDGTINDESYLKGYHKGYDENLPATPAPVQRTSEVTKRIVSEATRQKLRDIALAQKRNPETGQFC